MLSLKLHRKVLAPLQALEEIPALHQELMQMQLLNICEM